MMRLIQNRAASRLLALGALLAALMTASLMLAAKPSYASTTFYVNSTEDHADALLTGDQCDTGYDLPGGGQVDECTLRAAIQQANYTAGADAINFNVPGTGVHTIVPATQLPTVTGPVMINGYSQPGAQPNQKAVGSDAVLKIELSGAEAMNANALVLGAANTTVKGLVINNWQYAGVRVDGANATGNRISGNFIGTDVTGANTLTNDLGVRVYEGSNNTIGGTTASARNVISGNIGHGISIGDGGPNITGNKVIGNYIGTDATGTKNLGNGSDGVSIEDPPGTKTNTIIGGATAGERNVISGNNQSGVAIFGSGNKVAGNYIGTDATGTKDLGNSDSGIYIQEGSNNTVGGTEVGARNVISANDSEGVEISGDLARGNKVLGNYVGTDKTGAAPLGNSDQGLYIYNAPGNVIGGTASAARNVISGNDEEGVLIGGPGADGTTILGNYVGTDKTGAAPLGNDDDGVYIFDAANITIGGTEAGAPNVISANGGHGVEIHGDTATGNRILSNSIFANDLLGIELYGTPGPTPNDPDDADTGPNNLQNFPVLSSARKNAAGTTTVRGKLDSTPDKTFRVQFFSNPKGTDEGKTLLGSQLVSTDGSGDASFAFSTKKAIRLGQNVTATATGPGGNTSEFSAPRKVVSA